MKPRALADIDIAHVPEPGARMSDWGILYTNYNVPIVPIPAGTKGPSRPGWNKLSNCLTDPAAAESYYEEHPKDGLGMLLGEAGLGSLDVDDVALARRAFRAVGLDL